MTNLEKAKAEILSNILYANDFIEMRENDIEHKDIEVLIFPTDEFADFISKKYNIGEDFIVVVGADNKALKEQLVEFSEYEQSFDKDGSYDLVNLIDADFTHNISEKVTDNEIVADYLKDLQNVSIENLYNIED